MRPTILALLLFLSPTVSWADDLEVSFDLAQYSHNGNFSFSMGCLANPPTGRNNYVHITVVWIEDGNGNYITTLYRWGRTYHYNLKRWALSSDMAVDGITSATPTSNGNMPSQVFRNFTTGSHDISWLPDGNYRIRLESTQCELADEYRTGTNPLFGPEATFDFTKGRASQTTNLGSSAPFNNVTIDYVVPGGNQRPQAWAGVDQRLRPSVVPSESSTTLLGVIGDDSGNAPTASWQLVGVVPSGGSAQIASPSSAQTTVSFAVSGIYTFRLTATDGGGLTSSDEVEVWVNAFTSDATHDAEAYRGMPDLALGIIENSGPWVWGWGQCQAGEDYSRGYFRFDVSNVAGQITYARLRLPFAEASPDMDYYHDFYLLTDAQDDWNGNSSSSVDWEATLTFNNQPVPSGLASNLDPAQQMGSWRHNPCIFRHLFNDPDPPPGPGSDCPGWIEVDLDLTPVATYDTNREWSIFMTSRTGCLAGFGAGSKENLINPQLLLVEHWQSAANLPPAANAGADRVVTDALPSGTELVTLDGSGSTDDVGVASYSWRENGQLLGSSAQPDGVTVPLSLGIHDIELTVADGAGLMATDTVQIVVEDRFYPNHSDATAAVIDGDADGKQYDDLFGYTTDPDGDWYALDLIDGTDLGVSITMTGGDLDLALYRSDFTVVMASDSGALTESVAAPGLTAGRYYLQVSAKPAGESDYGMSVEVDGPTVMVTLNRASALESLGTLTAAGTVTLPEPAPAVVSVMLSSDLPEHLGFGTNPVTIAAGAVSADFDIVLVDDPPGAADAARYVNIVATAAGYNRGSAVFEILDDEASLVVTWDKAAEMIAETRSPLVVLTAQLSSPPASAVTVPFSISGTAQASDYTIMGSSTELTIEGSARAMLLLTINDDTEDEQPETVVIRMGTPDGANPGSITEYVLTIGDDDEPGMMMMPEPEKEGCACTAIHRPGSILWLLALAALAFVRRR